MKKIKTDLMQKLVVDTIPNLYSEVKDSQTNKCSKLFNQGLENYKNENWKKTIKIAKDLINLDCDNSDSIRSRIDEILYSYSIAYEELGNNDSSEYVLLESLENIGDDYEIEIKLRTRLANNYKKQGKLDLEIIEYEKIHNFNYLDPKILKVLGVLYEKSGSVKNQIYVLRLLSELEPNDNNILDKLDLLVSKYSDIVQELDASEDILEERLKVELLSDSTNSKAYFQLGKYYALDEDSTNALKNMLMSAKFGNKKQYDWFDDNEIKWTSYDGDFIKKRIGNYNGKKVGWWKYYNAFDGLEMEEYYENGKIEGLKTVYQLGGGGKYIEENYKNGKKHGKVIRYHSDGNIISEQNWFEDKLHGVTKSWYLNGKIRSIVNENLGLKDGMETKYYEDGKKKSECNYLKGKKNGVYKKWFENGVLAVEIKYENDNQIYYKSWLENGELKEEW